MLETVAATSSAASHAYETSQRRVGDERQGFVSEVRGEGLAAEDEDEESTGAQPHVDEDVSNQVCGRACGVL